MTSQRGGTNKLRRGVGGVRPRGIEELREDFETRVPVGALPDLLEFLEAVNATGSPWRRLVEVELPRPRDRHGFRCFAMH